MRNSMKENYGESGAALSWSYRPWWKGGRTPEGATSEMKCEEEQNSMMGD